ncbi:unnamed protein product, partial [Amoebophrya sp. A120]
NSSSGRAVPSPPAIPISNLRDSHRGRAHQRRPAMLSGISRTSQDWEWSSTSSSKEDIRGSIFFGADYSEGEETQQEDHNLERITAEMDSKL